MIKLADRVEIFGQVFTREDVVRQMLALRKNHGRVLEPSAGDGAFSRHLPGCVAIEIDASVAPDYATILDFMEYDASEKFDTIIGNPPYVRYQDILPGTKSLLDEAQFDGRSNLYLFFIKKCIDHLNPGGELIFITPRDFPKLTAAKRLNSWLFDQGTITDFIETGDSTIFGRFVPNCAIFRFEKGRMDRRMHDGRTFAESDGQLMFVRASYSVPMSELFDVKVGAVSGADEIFVHPKGNLDFVCSTTIDTDQTRPAYFGVKNRYLEGFRDQLLARRVRKFDESNWWMWGRIHHISAADRIYVNVKTRRPAPFFLNDCKNYDGSILALFPKDKNMDLRRAVEQLNTAINWDDLGFVCDGRFIFSQRSLQNCLLPEGFNAAKKVNAQKVSRKAHSGLSRSSEPRVRTAAKQTRV
jgi:adenine-specific DNA-methyltransferase